MNNTRISRYRVFRAGLIAFMCGVAVAFTGVVQLFDAYFFLLCVGVIGVLARTKTGILSACIIAACFALGSMRVVSMPTHAAYALPVQPFSFRGVVIADPTALKNRQRLTLDLEQNADVSFSRMVITVPATPSIGMGETIEGTCSGVKQQARGGTVFQEPSSLLPPICTRADMTNHTFRHFSLTAALARVRDFFTRAIRSGLPTPESDLLSGILVGTRGMFSPELSASFRTSGLSHIVAVSGSNISLVIAGLWSILQSMRVSRKKSIGIVMGVMGLFVLLTGATSATVRAGVMGMMVLAAQYMGRLSASVTTLLAAGATMVLITPTILWFDVGFQLSYLATLGIVVFSPLIAQHLKRVPAWGGFRDIIAQTVAAITFTSPLIIAVFQSFSVVGLVANILVVPIIPFIMELGFVWSVVAALSYGVMLAFHVSLQPLVAFLGIPVYGFLSYVVTSASLLSSVPYASISLDVGVWTPLFLLGSYAGIAAFTLFLKRRMSLIDQENGVV